MARFFHRFLILAAIVFLALNVMAYLHARSMLYFSSSNTPRVDAAQLSFTQKVDVLFTGITMSRPEADIKPSSLGHHCTRIRIPNGAASFLGTWYCPNTHEDRLVILFHGYAMDKSSQLNVARFFIAAKYSVLLVDFRGSWESSESYTTIGYDEADDVATTINYARQNPAHQKIILYGQSMGAAAILRAVHSLDIHADALILELVFDDLLNTVKNRFSMMNLPAFPAAHLLVLWGSVQTDFNGFTHNPVTYAKTVDIPTLFLHGDADTRSRLSEALRVYNAVPITDKKISVFKDAAHESLLSKTPRQWIQEVQHFLNKYLNMY